MISLYSKISSISSNYSKRWVRFVICQIAHRVSLVDFIIGLYYILSSNKGIFVWPIWLEVNCPYFHTRENNRLLDYCKIISISRPILARTNMGLDFVSGQYGRLFSRCRKYVINSLIHGHFHIGSRLRLGPIWGSQDDNQANMEMPMY